MNCISFDGFLVYRLFCANERVPEMQVTIYLANGQVSVSQLGKPPIELALSSSVCRLQLSHIFILLLLNCIFILRSGGDFVLVPPTCIVYLYKRIIG